MNIKIYLYLIKEPNRFKIGYTKNPKQRFRVYKEHNTKLKVSGIFEVPNKDFESLVHLELLKNNYKRCLTYKEWFEGDVSNHQIENIIKKFEERQHLFITKPNITN